MRVTSSAKSASSRRYSASRNRVSELGVALGRMRHGRGSGVCWPCNAQAERGEVRQRPFWGRLPLARWERRQGACGWPGVHYFGTPRRGDGVHMRRSIPAFQSGPEVPRGPAVWRAVRYFRPGPQGSGPLAARCWEAAGRPFLAYVEPVEWGFCPTRNSQHWTSAQRRVPGPDWPPLDEPTLARQRPALSHDGAPADSVAAAATRRPAATYLGCSCRLPGGVPGAGTTLLSPVGGGRSSRSLSAVGGGQMTPFDSASRSLRSGTLGPPTVGDVGRWVSCRASGLHDGSGAGRGCTELAWAAATVTHATCRRIDAPIVVRMRVLRNFIHSENAGTAAAVPTCGNTRTL
jgi:hypothetical protein